MQSDAERAARFVRHLEPLRGALEAYCRHHVNDPGAIEDILQSAVAKAFRDFHLYVENTNFRAWIFKYAHFETLNWNRRQRPRPDSSAVTELPVPDTWEAGLAGRTWDDLLRNAEDVLDDCDEELAHAMGELPPLERAVMLLRALGDFKYREIGEILEIPVGSVMGYLGRARAFLRQRLAEHCRQRGVQRSRRDRQAGGGPQALEN